MAVHTGPDKIVVATMTSDIRFDDAYRYLDRCGETISRIRKIDQKWVPIDPNPQSGQIVHTDRDISVRLDTERLIVSRKDGTWLSPMSAEKLATELGIQTEILYQLVVDTLSIPNTTRIGTRFLFIAPADTLEDCERLLARAPQSPLTKLITDSGQGVDLCGSTFRFQIEEEETGYRRTFQVSPAHISSPTSRKLLNGFNEETVTCGVAVDIDTFTRPAEGHFVNTSNFIRSAYLRSHSLSLSIFRWLATGGKGT